MLSTMAMTEVLSVHPTRAHHTTIANTTTSTTTTTLLDVYRRHLPPYRLLLNPSLQYDYQTHRFVQLSPTDIVALSQALETTGNHTLLFLTLNLAHKPKLGLMKYRLLLSDVGRSLSRIGRRPTLASTTTASSTAAASTTTLAPPVPPLPASFLELPAELTEYIVYLVDDAPLWRNCMDCCKQLYAVAKPYYYQHLQFTLTYRLAQFVTYLRVNPRVGDFVELIDLSHIAPGIDPEELDSILSLAEGVLFLEALARARAGWRDWKFANNPLYSRPSVPVAPPSLTLLTKTVSNDTTVTLSLATLRSFRFFKRRKRSRLAPPVPQLSMLSNNNNTTTNNSSGTTSSSSLEPRRRPQPVVLDLRQRRRGSHPTINKYLVDYATSKDVPAGYIIHLLNLCPNLVSLNLGNLSISPDYEVAPQRAALKYQTFDTMNNCNKYVAPHLEMLNGLPDIPRAANAANFVNDSSCALLIRTQLRPRYMSLLTPMPLSHDAMYCQRGDGRVFLSDLSVKALNRDHLVLVPELEVLTTLADYGRRTTNRMRYVNLSLMVWLNKLLVSDFLRQFVASADLEEVDEFFDLGDGWHEPPVDDDDADDTDARRREIRAYRQSLVLDLTDLGMYKLLPWAKRLDLSTYAGCQLVRQISGDCIPDPFQEFMRRERIRRGRVGENYFGG